MDIYASDEEKAEEIKRWWRENGRSVVTGVMLGLALIFAGRFWMSYQQNKMVQASLIYQQVLTSLNDDELEQAATATDGLMKDYADSGYAVFSALQLASESKEEAKVKRYLDWVIHNASLTAHQELARLRLARFEAANGETDSALKLISGSKAQAYQSLFSELEGDIRKEMGDKAAALAAYQRAIVAVDAGANRQSLLQLKIDDVAVANES